MKTVKELTAKLAEIREFNNNVWAEYYSLEGKYATDYVKVPCVGMGTHDYGYVYKTPADKAKEDAEREAVLTKLVDVRPVKCELTALKNKLYLEKHGVTRAENAKVRRVQQYKKELAEHEKRVAELKALLKNA